MSNSESEETVVIPREESTSPRQEKATAIPWFKLVAAVAAVALLVYLSRYVNLQGAIDTIKNLGAVGALLFVVVYILACVFMVPASVLTAGAGLIYGVVYGTLLVSLASTLGATAAFLLGRGIARDWIGKRIEGNPSFVAIDKAVSEEGWKIVGLTRLSPVFPFNLLNYAFGLTKVSLRDYFLASWIGMLPGTVLYVYLGSAAGLAVGDADTSTVEKAFFAGGLLVTFFVTVLVTRIARKAVNRHVPLDAKSA